LTPGEIIEPRGLNARLKQSSLHTESCDSEIAMRTPHASRAHNANRSTNSNYATENFA
jgi:hypothetical protein